MTSNRWQPTLVRVTLASSLCALVSAPLVLQQPPAAAKSSRIRTPGRSQATERSSGDRTSVAHTQRPMTASSRDAPNTPGSKQTSVDRGAKAPPSETWMIILTALLVIVGVIQSAIFALQLRVFNKQERWMRNTFAEMKNATEESKVAISLARGGPH
jgi:hypothetical protein